MPIFNGDTFLKESIESILNQTYRNFELILIDDGSTDRTPVMLDNYSDHDKRIRVFHQPHSGLIKSLNKGLELAKGKYLARMDADDISLPERLEKQAAYLENNPEVGVCGTWAKKFGLPNKNQTIKMPTSPEEIKSGLLFNNTLIHPTVMMRLSSLRKYNLYYCEDHLSAEDYGLWLRCSFNFSLANIPQVLLNYRVRKESVTSQVFSRSESYQHRYAAIKRVYKIALTHLGVDVTPEALELHFAIYYSGLPRDAGFLDRAENWLALLRSTNLKTKKFSQEALEKRIGMKWYTVCSTTTSLGMSAWQSYWNSPLKNYYRINYNEWVKFLLKCILRANTLQTFPQ